MLESTKTSSENRYSKKTSNNSLEDKLHLYQISELHKEIDFLKRRLSLIPEPVEILCKHMREFWWTLTSLAGFSWLHDGTRAISQNVAQNPTIDIPTISLQHMPPPRLFLDVTATYKSNLNTGVQRVVRELCRHGETNGALAPVIIDQERFVTVPDLIPLAFQQEDRLLLLDSSWTITNLYPPALKNARAQGAEIILGIYDLIPVQYPGFVQPRFTQLFNEWLNTITPFCTAALAISRYSAESFLTWAQENSNLTSIQSIGWFHLGADFPDKIKFKDTIVPGINEIPDNFLLSVGTIEPRKGYTTALDAFDQLWAEGSSLAYVIIGRRGDLATHTIDRISNHPQFGRKLFWPQNVDDILLAHYYKKSIGLLIPALAEGFGLPLIEASFYQKPTIASDLPVFKEISPVGVCFFQAADSEDLTNIIRGKLLQIGLPITDSILSWDNATQNMINIIRNNNFQITRDNSRNQNEYTMKFNS